jgi:hypothetical protein
MNLNVELPKDSYEMLVTRAENQGFDSPEEYGSMILRTVIDELEGPEEDDAVRDRLEDLGYV